MLDRRKFLKYMVAGTTANLAIGCFFSRSTRGQEIELESLCEKFPYNSRCKNYLPGVRAVDDRGEPIELSSLLEEVKEGIPVAVEGLAKKTYLVIETGPVVARYGITPVCTHFGCTVNWIESQQRFVCPCHGAEYDSQGRVKKGPASRGLPLVTVVTKQNQVRLIDRSPARDPRN